MPGMNRRARLQEQGDAPQAGPSTLISGTARGIALRRRRNSRVPAATARSTIIYPAHLFCIFDDMEYSKEAYDARIAALFERHQSVQSVGFTREAYKPGLEAMLQLDAALGRPSEKFRSVHVAGTNGKGSVAAFVSSILQAASFASEKFDVIIARILFSNAALTLLIGGIDFGLIISSTSHSRRHSPFDNSSHLPRIDHLILIHILSHMRKSRRRTRTPVLYPSV